MNARESAIVDSVSIGRLGTISENGWPHVVPVGYLFFRGAFYVPTNQSAVKMDNTRRDSRATIVIDDEEMERGVMLECKVDVLSTTAADRWRKSMREKKGWRNDQGTAVIRLTPMRKVSWFLKG